MPRLHICIKLAYGNGGSDSICGKICDVHTFRKYANNAAIAYSHKACMSVQIIYCAIAPVLTTEHTTTQQPMRKTHKNCEKLTLKQTYQI